MSLKRAFPREELRAQLQSFGATWLRRDQQQRCDWCRAPLTQDDANAFVDFCIQLGKLLHPRTPLPKSKVPCIECAGGAMTELVDGIPFSPNARPSTEPEDPWSRPRWTPPAEERERYP